MPSSTPRLNRFLASLPHGLASYPECEAKGSLLRSELSALDVSVFDRQVPPELHELITSPPPVSVWFSEVHRMALHYATLDLVFHGDESAMDQFVFEGNRRVLLSPVYSVLVRGLSMERILQSWTLMWRQFHRGTSHEVLSVSVAEKHAVLCLRGPAALLEPLTMRGRPALRAMGESGSAKDVKVTTSMQSEQEILFRVKWQ